MICSRSKSACDLLRLVMDPQSQPSGRVAPGSDRRAVCGRMKTETKEPELCKNLAPTYFPMEATWGADFSAEQKLSNNLSIW